MAGLELASKVSCTEPYFVGNENSDIKVAVLDLGVKKNILRCLEKAIYHFKNYCIKAFQAVFLCFSLSD